MTSVSTPASAQFTTARLSGVILDPSGSAVPGATITIRDVGTAYTQTTQSGSSGEYLFPSLPVGNYQITVTMSGYETYSQKGLSLAVGQAATIRIPLKIGSLSQQVSVVANTSMVTTDSPTVGQVIDQKDIVGLPLNGRNVQQLVFLAPGATNVTSHYCAANCEGGVFPSEQYAKINGAGANGTNYQLDGVNYNDTYLNSNVPFPNPDALQEFNLVTGNMSATYGNAIGGVVNVVTKSGTDQIHGDIFEFIRNSALDAKDYFSDSVNPLKQNQFGGSIGGPILKDRLFYFGTYQGTRFVTTNNGQITFVPNAVERTGDFSDLLPATQLMNPNTGVPYQNNQVPVSPVAQYFLQHVPLPNGPDDQLTFNGSPDAQNTDEFMGKLDYNIGKHHISGHYFQMNYTDPIAIPPSTNVLELRGDAEHLTLKSISVVDIYTISPAFLLSSYFGYTSVNGNTLSAAPFDMANAGVGIAQPANLGGGNSPSLDVTIGGSIDLYQAPYGVWDRGDQSLREIATIEKGHNELQVGGEGIRIRLPMGNQYLESGIFDFTNDLTGNNMADFEVGDVSSFTQGGGLYLNFTGIKWAAFVQDNWKATPRLTLNAGLRWDPFFPYTDSEGRVACFVPGAQSVRFPNAPTDMLFGGEDHDSGCPESSVFNNPYNFGPRLGFAYQLTQDGKTSLRGGSGYYYEPPNTVAFEDVVGIPPFAPTVNLTDVDLANPYGSAGIANPFPTQYGPIDPGANAPFPQDISFEQIFDRHFRLPMVLAYNLTLERAIGADWMLRASYVGNNGHHLNGTGDQEAGLLQLNPAVYVPGASTESNTQQRRVYPDFGSIGSINSGVNSNYNAGQITLEKRFTKGLSILTNYTWARGLDDYAPIGAANGTNTCSCGRYFDYGPSDDDLNKTFKINGDYEVPSVHLQRLADKLVNGWEVTAIANWNSGYPFTIFSGYDNSFSEIGSDRADLAVPSLKSAILGTGRSHSALTSQWFNTAAFVPNQIGTFGDTGKNVLRGPRYFNTDLAAIRNATIAERYSVQFRAEFYNAFNNVNFGNPGNILADSGFGQITGLAGASSANTYGTAQPRIIQFGLKLAF